MFVQHFKLQGRRFTNFHYYYSVLVWMKVIYFAPFTRILEWNKAYQCSFTKKKSFPKEFYILKRSVSQMKRQKCDFYSFKVCFSSLITNVETMCGDFLWYVLINQWFVHRKFLPRSSQNTDGSFSWKLDCRGCHFPNETKIKHETFETTAIFLM